MKRTVKLGIQVEEHPFDKGYWARFDGEPRPVKKSERRAGWDACDTELRADSRAKRHTQQ